MLFFEICYIIFCILLAALNASLIAEGKTIYHWINGLLHIAAATVAAFIWWLPAFIIVLCLARIFFDFMLNIFRGLPLAYVPLNPKSVVDKVEKRIFGTNAFFPKAIYFLTSFSLNAIYLIFIK